MVAQRRVGRGVLVLQQLVREARHLARERADDDVGVRQKMQIVDHAEERRERISAFQRRVSRAGRICHPPDVRVQKRGLGSQGGVVRGEVDSERRLLSIVFIG